MKYILGFFCPLLISALASPVLVFLDDDLTAMAWVWGVGLSVQAGFFLALWLYMWRNPPWP